MKKKVMILILGIVVLMIFTSCVSLFKIATSPKYEPYVPPAPVITYKRGRPQVYDFQKIRRIAVLSFGNEEFTDLFTGLMVNYSRWQVIDRANLQTIIREQRLQSLSIFNNETAVRIGKLAGVDMVVFGQYRGSSVVVKAIDVETAQYLAYETIDLKYDIKYNSMLATTVILPYTIKYIDGRNQGLTVGHEADTYRK